MRHILKSIDEKPPSICIIGGTTEGRMLSTLFANAGLSNYLVDSTIESSSPQQHLTHGDSSFVALQDSGMITVVPSLDTVPLSTIDVFFLTTHAAALSERVRHETFLKKMASEIVEGSWIIYTGLCSPGYTMVGLGGIVEKFTGLRLGKEVGIGYFPFIATIKGSKVLRETPRMFASTPGVSTSKIQEIILQVFPSLHLNHDVKLVETAALYNAASQEVAQALQFELAIAAHRDGIDYSQMIQLTSLMENNTLLSSNQSRPLQTTASTIMADTLRTGIIHAAGKVNRNLQQDVLKLVKSALKKNGQSLRRSKIAILGPEWFSNENSTVDLPQIVRVLARRGATVSIYAQDRRWKLPDAKSSNVKLETDPMRALSKANCALVALSNLSQEKLDAHRMALEMSRPGTVCDLTGVMIASNVEQAGLTYTSLGGRGSPVI